jgi:hypothetical protein
VLAASTLIANSPVQPPNAFVSKEVTPLPMVTLVRLLLP